MITRSQREPRFLWTGLMILGPVIALGAVALWQLRQDRAAALAAAQQDADEQVSALLDVAGLLFRGRQPGSVPDVLTGILDPAGTPVPAPYPDPPIPTAEPSQSATDLLRLLDEQAMDPAEKARAATQLATLGGVTAGGLPVRQLALHLALRSGAQEGIEKATLQNWAEQLCEGAVSIQPSVATGSLLVLARHHLDPERRAHWDATWQRAERFQTFFSEYKTDIRILARRYSNAWTLGWLNDRGSEPSFLCSINSQDEGDGEVLALEAIPIAQIQVTILEALPPIPQHLGLRLWISGQIAFELKADQESKVLAVKSRSQPGMRAEVLLADEDTLFAPVVERTRRTAVLIALAILAAAVGWFAAWRAFVRQQQLAAMKDNFVSAVSHELKTPIASIGLMAEELGAGSDKRD